MQFKSIDIDGLNIFYREAGKPGTPKLVLLHGFASSSHQYRNLMRELEPYFHVIAPDYPGFGGSAMPSRDEYSYTFDRTSQAIETFLEHVGFTRFGLFLQGHGGPVGFRIIQRRPDWLHWLIIQNASAHEEGLTGMWDALRGTFWGSRAPEAERALLPLLEREAIKAVYVHGPKNPLRICPDSWNMDAYFLERPGARQVQLDFLYDYRTNVALYPKWQAFLRKRQPKALIFWGQDDLFFTREGGEAYLRELPDAEMHRLESGHFALEEHLEYISRKMIEFNEGLWEEEGSG